MRYRYLFPTSVQRPSGLKILPWRLGVRSLFLRLGVRSFFLRFGVRSLFLRLSVWSLFFSPWRGDYFRVTVVLTLPAFLSARAITPSIPFVLVISGPIFHRMNPPEVRGLVIDSTESCVAISLAGQ